VLPGRQLIEKGGVLCFLAFYPLAVVLKDLLVASHAIVLVCGKNRGYRYAPKFEGSLNCSRGALNYMPGSIRYGDDIAPLSTLMVVQLNVRALSGYLNSDNPATRSGIVQPGRRLDGGLSATSFE